MLLSYLRFDGGTSYDDMIKALIFDFGGVLYFQFLPPKKDKERPFSLQGCLR